MQGVVRGYTVTAQRPLHVQAPTGLDHLGICPSVRASDTFRHYFGSTHLDPFLKPRQRLEASLRHDDLHPEHQLRREEISE